MGSLNDYSKRIRQWSWDSQAVRQVNCCPDNVRNLGIRNMDQSPHGWDPNWQQSRIALPEEFCKHLESYHGHGEQNK